MYDQIRISVRHTIEIFKIGEFASAQIRWYKFRLNGCVGTGMEDI